MHFILIKYTYTHIDFKIDREIDRQCVPGSWWAPPRVAPSCAWGGPAPSRGAPASGDAAGRTGPAHRPNNQWIN